jgi:protein dithiol oxidoreductase (disulfide-forming)
MRVRASGLALALLITLAACSQNSGSNPAGHAGANAGATSSTAPAAVPAPASTPADAAPPATQAPTSAGESTDIAPDSSKPSALERVAPLPAAGSLPSGRWVAGKHYRVLSPAQPTSAAPGKVEVVEIFWYGCPHCYALEPFIAAWLKTAPPYIEFVRLPATFNAAYRSHAHLFYTLQALGAADRLHPLVFNEIHVNKNMLLGSDDAASFKLQQAFAKAKGISDKDFAQAYESFSVQTKLQQSNDLLLHYRVDSVPLVVVNGKYATDVGMADGQANLISLISDLAAAEKRH